MTSPEQSVPFEGAGGVTAPQNDVAIPQVGVSSLDGPTDVVAPNSQALTPPVPSLGDAPDAIQAVLSASSSGGSVNLFDDEPEGFGPVVCKGTTSCTQSVPDTFVGSVTVTEDSVVVSLGGDAPDLTISLTDQELLGVAFARYIDRNDVNSITDGMIYVIIAAIESHAGDDLAEHRADMYHDLTSALFNDFISLDQIRALVEASERRLDLVEDPMNQVGPWIPVEHLFTYIPPSEPRSMTSYVADAVAWSLVEIFLPPATIAENWDGVGRYEQEVCNEAWCMGLEAAGMIPGGAVASKLASRLASKGLKGLSKLVGRLGDICARANSFAAGTKVAAASGAIAISSLAVGQEVYAYNETTGEVELQEITATHVHDDPVIIDLTVDPDLNDNQPGELIETTPEHPFYVLGEWVNGEDLEVGMPLSTFEGTSLIHSGTVTSIEREERVQTMYNLTVAEAHTFFVGEGEWLVHNCGEELKDAVDAGRGLWNITKENTSRVMSHNRFGKIYQHDSTNLWWSKDLDGHGGSVWKVFTKEGNKLRWVADADEYGDFIIGKHKGPTGLEIPWKELNGSNF